MNEVPTSFNEGGSATLGERESPGRIKHQCSFVALRIPGGIERSLVRSSVHGDRGGVGGD